VLLVALLTTIKRCQQMQTVHQRIPPRLGPRRTALASGQAEQPSKSTCQAEAPAYTHKAAQIHLVSPAAAQPHSARLRAAMPHPARVLRSRLLPIHSQSRTTSGPARGPTMRCLVSGIASVGPLASLHREPPEESEPSRPRAAILAASCPGSKAP
jgi:hypothetical protein